MVCKVASVARAADGAVLGILLASGIGACLLVSVQGHASSDAAALPPDPARILHLVDLRTAGATELRLLPGVGPRMASRIAGERDAGGTYDSLEDLDRRVPGVGPASVRRWRDRILDPRGEGR